MEKIGTGKPVAEMAEQHDGYGHPDYRETKKFKTDQRHISQQEVLWLFLTLSATIFS